MGYVGIEEDYYISVKSVLDIIAETGALTTQSRIRELTPTNVAPVKHGRWIKYTGLGKVQWMCSECSAEENNPKVANYCYHCGAKMDKKAVETND